MPPMQKTALLNRLMDLFELPVVSPPKSPPREAYRRYILGDFKKSGSPRIGGWGANSYRNSATPKKPLASP
jgi:hypothetical protein